MPSIRALFCAVAVLIALAAMQTASASSAPYKPQQPLHRGLHLLAVTPTRSYGNLTPYKLDSTHVLTYPVSVDLSRYDPPVGDQGWVGSCTAWASTYTLAGWYIDKEKLPVGMAAPMYTYRQINAGQDGGSWGYLALGADNLGMVPMSLFPQGNYNWNATPTGTQMALARHLKVSGGTDVYLSTKGESASDARYQIELGLALGHPELVELAVYENMYDATAQSAWIGPKSGKLEGGHALVAVGYDDRGLWVENQWGTQWGLNGYAELSWDYVAQAVYDASVINGVTLTPGLPVPYPYRGTPQIASSIVADGIPVKDQSALRDDQEVVWTAKGFKPGENVRLYWDGQYHSYLQAQGDGTWSLEWYDHHSYHFGPHNIKPAPGLHTMRAVGDSGDYAWITINVR